MKAADKYFLPYQRHWLRDNSRFKVWEKSRRIGATYVQAYEDVLDGARAEGGMDVWFSSADESAAKEYIRYCADWAAVLKIAADDLGEVVLDKKDGIKALVIEFASGHRINALSSNPKGFRSKGGKVVVDEFAFHAQPDDLWKAAGPAITWGYPIRVLSTYNGKGNRYYRMVSEARKGNKWSLHTTTIEDAVKQGLVGKITGKDTAPARAAFLAETREIAGDEETYLQEYMCQPVDEASAWLPWSLITACEHDEAGMPARYEGGISYVGMDIARRRDLTIIWAIEAVGDVIWTREVVSLKRERFAVQEAELDRMIARYRPLRVCIDQTGMGEKFVEDAQGRHGAYLVEGIGFTAAVKMQMATLIKERFEDRAIRIPADKAIRASLHSVRRETTSAGNIRFDAARTEVGHADEFWALGLALHAAGSGAPPAYGGTLEHQSAAMRYGRTTIGRRIYT